jgi:hypothetical protein
LHEAPLQLIPQVEPEQVTPPRHELSTAQMIDAASAVFVMPPKHEFADAHVTLHSAPEQVMGEAHVLPPPTQPTLHFSAVHETPPSLHALSSPHFTAHEEPAHATAPHDRFPEQSRKHALAFVQSTPLVQESSPAH